MDKIFLRAPLVPMERRAPSAPIDSQGQHLWQLIVGQRPLGGEGELASYDPRSRLPHE